MDAKRREGGRVAMQVRIMGYRGEDKWLGKQKVVMVVQ
jgi:hypothetical protein